MKVAVIAALASNKTIGRNNSLPWRLPKDLARFKALTLGHACVQGRKTFESIGKPLPNRLNIIVSRDTAFKANGCLVANSLPAALELAEKGETNQKDTVFVCGGSALYEEAIPVADVLYLTRVEADIEGDAWFPQWNEDEWELVKEEKHEKDEKHEFAYTFATYERKRAPVKN
jgi:dihydrofolate reductase